jgi:hypothetical protein
MKSEMADEINEWLEKLDPDVREGYGDTVICFPLFYLLLKKIDYPIADQLYMDGRLGFSLFSDIPPGAGWPLTLDKGPLDPAGNCGHAVRFEDFNDDHVRSQVKARGPCKHVDALLAEVEADRDIGRIRGRFAAPEKWGVEAVHPRDNHKGKNELLPRPSDDACYAAFAFPIEQIGSDGSGKVRRGEDWLRSGHNVQATTLDKPVHYTVDHQVECARRLKRRRLPKAVTWGQDHEGACRQLPGRPRSVMWMILMTMNGLPLWQHLMTLFGSKAAVWAYNRFGDAIMHVVRIMLCLLLVHYVDDYSGVDPEPIAPSGFHAFEDVMQLLGVMLNKNQRDNHPLWNKRRRKLIWASMTKRL